VDAERGATEIEPGGVTPGGAERAVAHLMELSAEVRGCAVLDAAGAAPAASGDPARWAAAAAAFLGAADAAAGGTGRPGRAAQAHVGTEDGEAFAVRHGDLAMVAVTERFTLASLVLFDMRTILRDLAGGGVVDRRAAGAGTGPAARAA
jgi:predicted regulator of Ras-like GTPase activity (Roadblock/LC7/MglB family)